MRQESAGPQQQELTHRLNRINVVAAVAFVLGGTLFALGAAFAQLSVGTTAMVNITYLAIVNWGTFAGAACFALGGVIQAFDKPTSTRTVV